MSSVARPLAFCTGLVCVATLLAYGGRWLWFCELLVNFRTHFALLLGLALLLSLVFRQWRIACLAVVGVALNVWSIYDAFLGERATSEPSANARAVRVVEFNVHISNEDLPGIAAYLKSLEPDVVVLEELSPAAADSLASLLPQLPHRFSGEGEGIWSVVIMSRWPLIAPRRATRGGRVFALRTDVNLGDRQLRLYGSHLNWPVMPGTAQVRNAQLQALAHELSECAHACVAVGDFNVTPWSSHFRDVLKTPGIRDCAAGRGLLNTWTSSLPAFLRIRIDQCLTAGAVSVADVRVGESVGSDHFATINDFSIGAR